MVLCNIFPSKYLRSIRKHSSPAFPLKQTSRTIATKRNPRTIFFIYWNTIHRKISVSMSEPRTSILETIVLFKNRFLSRNYHNNSMSLDNIFLFQISLNGCSNNKKVPKYEYIMVLFFFASVFKLDSMLCWIFSLVHESLI